MGKHSAETGIDNQNEGKDIWETDMDSVLNTLDQERDLQVSKGDNRSISSKMEDVSISGFQQSRLDEVKVKEEAVEDEESEDGLSDDNDDLPEDDEPFVDTYFDDDEEFLAGDDRTLTEEQDMALFKRAGDVVRWKISNLYQPDGSFRRGNVVRANPPVLTISDSDGREVNFTVTREFAASMESVMHDAKIAHLSSTLPPWATPTRKYIDDDTVWWQKIVNWGKEHKIRAGILVVVIIYILVIIVQSVFK